MKILPPYIIEKIRQYEEERRRMEDEQRPRVWIPVPDLPREPYGCPESGGEDDNPRGVIIMDIDSYENEDT